MAMGVASEPPCGLGVAALATPWLGVACQAPLARSVGHPMAMGWLKMGWWSLWLPSFYFLFWCFVVILSFCTFFEMLMCHVVIGGQKTHVFCYNRIVAALYKAYKNSKNHKTTWKDSYRLN
jgi:hypothetical protein